MWLGLFIASFVVNVFFLFYIRWLLKAIAIMGEDMEGVSGLIKEYVNHLNTIHEMEMFYGDQTLQALIEHGTELSNTLDEIDFLLNEEELDASEEEALKEE